MLTSSYLRSKKTLGQHFLFDQKVLNKIVDAAEVSRKDLVLEIGPGKGSLTQKLVMRARKVVAVELDQSLALGLEQKFKPYRNLEVVKGDILKFSLAAFKGDYKVIGNIPYYISGKILRKFTQNRKRPQIMVLLVQKEVGERVCAQPGKMSILSVAVQTFGKPEIIDYVPRYKFEPPPQVDSAILKITMFPKSRLARALNWFGFKRARISSEEMSQQEEDFFRLVKIGFSAKRKQIHNNLRNGYHLTQEAVDAWLSRTEIKKTARPQELAVDDWIRLLENQVLE